MSVLIRLLILVSILGMEGVLAPSAGANSHEPKALFYGRQNWTFLDIHGTCPVGYSRLRDMIRDRGWEVLEADETYEGLTRYLLDDVSLLVLSANLEPHSPGEAALVEEFVQRGGSLLVLGGVTTGSEGSVSDNSLIGFLGAQYLPVSRLRMRTRVTDISPHPITEGVSEFSAYGVNFINLGTGLLEPLAWLDGQLALAAGEYGSGRAVVFFDDITFINGPAPDNWASIDQADNWTLAENIFDYLVTDGVPMGGSPPEPTPLPDWEPGDAGYALSFDGIDDLVQLAPFATGGFLHDGFSAMTVEFFVRARTETSYGILFDIGGSSNGIGARFWKGSLHFAVRTESSTTGIQGKYASTASWHHVACVFDHGTLRLYVDGTLFTQGAGAGSTVGLHGDPSGLGRRLEGGAFLDCPRDSWATDRFDGVIDELRIWQKARSAAEIQATMLVQPETGFPSLAAYYPFDSGSGQTAWDASGNGHHVPLGFTTDEEPEDPTWVRSDAPLWVEIPPTPEPTPEPEIRLWAHIDPAKPDTLDNLECVTEVENNGGSAELWYSYRWFRNGEELLEGIEVDGEILSVTEQVLSHHFTAKHDTFFCMVEVTDGLQWVEATTEPVTIVNAPPTSPEFVLIPENPTPDDGLAVWIVSPSVDPDGDPVGLVFEWFESSDKGTWTLRSEMSGHVDPYNPGQSEVSSLYTQMAEYWRVVVTPVELAISERTRAPEPGEVPEEIQVFVTGDSRGKDVFILPDLNGDDQVDGGDLLVLRSVWHKQKGELDSPLRELFFETEAPAEQQIGVEQLFRLGAKAWHAGRGR